MTKDAFERWRQWARKPVESPATIPAELHNPIMELTPEEREDRETVNAAVERYQWPAE